MRCIVCDCCAGVCPTKCLTMETQYPVAFTARGGVTKVTVAGPKRKEPVAGADGAPAKKE